MRLKDIEVDEVSLVDKAANNKKFAFLKRDAEDHKEIEKTEEVKEAEKLLNKEVPPTDEPTAEELALIADLSKQIAELTAQVQKA
jgi:hypothetical protein